MHFCFKSPPSVTFQKLVIAAALLSSSEAFSRTLNPGESAVVTNPPAPEAWVVSQGGTLTIDNAQALTISSSNANVVFNGGQSARIDANTSVVNLSGATVNSAAGRGAIQLIDSSAIIDNSTIISTNSFGLLLGRNTTTPASSSATVKGGSTIIGLNGADAVGFAVLNVENSTVRGTGSDSYGVRLGGATLSANGSVLSGEKNGLQINTDLTGVNANTVTLNSTRVTGGTGSAILLGSSGAAGTVANISISGTSELIGGNGNLLQATNRSTANLTIDGSALDGNVVADTGSTVALLMKNAASINGNLQNVTQVSLDSNSTLNGNVQAVAGTAATVNLNNNSAINGNVDNVVSLALNNGSRITGNVLSDANGSVSLDNRSVLNGNADNVSSLALTNGSSMTGDVVTGINGNVLLDNGSVLTGKVNNSGNLSINNAAQWVMTGDNAIQNLTSNGGIVRMGTNEQFLRLDVANVSGNVTVFTGTDLSTGNTDFFNAGHADGQIKFDVTATGNNPLTAEDVHIGIINSGNADVSLNNGETVDGGTFVYRLAREGEGLYLRPDKETVSKSTNTALALAGSARSITYAETTMLSEQVGERGMSDNQMGSLRAAGDDAVMNLSNSVWVHTYGNQYSVKNAYGDGYTQNQRGITAGADTAVDLAGRLWVLGGFFGSSHTEMDLKYGSSATVTSLNAGVYGNTFDVKSGVFVNVMAKINEFDHKAKVIMSDGTPAKGDFKALGVSGSVAVGKHIRFDSGYFIEPKVQLATAITQSDNYRLDNGLEVESDAMRSFQGKVGIRGGVAIALEGGGVLEPSLVTAVTHEFVKTNEVTINDDDAFDDDRGRSAVEYGVRLKWTPAQKNWQVSGQVGGSKGKTVSQDWSGNLWLSYFF
ncbi:autotransporter outer membrane beta-barrel domain-containing protein [Pseudomonas sp. 31-12]|uniref:autotransporter outer membrane beta-barrel domain-containing protein n=1 Tax=Pseudomonas sp. 31-12 TaxID=2201356 RepID=UPI000D6C1706|nr:autotransporter outer membrane beta-barrel domain-containing protein [Pseudomonas sp. 31-12]AWM92443.1 autotransporter outer membrane beta-barrel domain-containing protein [Pseudomonas sp. 31-12]